MKNGVRPLLAAGFLSVATPICPFDGPVGAGQPKAGSRVSAAVSNNALHPASFDSDFTFHAGFQTNIFGDGQAISGGGAFVAAPDKKPSPNSIGGSSGGGGGGGRSGGGGGGGTQVPGTSGPGIGIPPRNPPPNGPATVPTLASVSPQTATIGQNLSLSLSGGAFASGASIHISGPSSFTLPPQNVGATQAVWSGTLGGNPPGAYQATIINPNGSTSAPMPLTINPEIVLSNLPSNFVRAGLAPGGFDFYQFKLTIPAGVSQVNTDLGNPQPAGLHLMWKASANGLISTPGWPACDAPNLDDYKAAIAWKTSGHAGPITIGAYQDWIVDGGIGSGLLSNYNYCVGALVYNAGTAPASYTLHFYNFNNPPPPPPPPPAPSCFWSYYGFSPAPPPPSTACAAANKGQVIGGSGAQYTCTCQ